MNWNKVELEVSFFYALNGHKPVGIAKHFQMLFLHDKFCRLVNQEVTSQVLWEHLEELWDLEALDKSEISPFPNARTVDFELPDDEFGQLIQIRKKAAGNDLSDEDTTSDDVRSSSVTNVSEDESTTDGDVSSERRLPPKKPATGGKTGKGDWTPAKACPIPTFSYTARARRAALSEAAMSVPSPNSSSVRNATPATGSEATTLTENRTNTAATAVSSVKEGSKSFQADGPQPNNLPTDAESSAAVSESTSVTSAVATGSETALQPTANATSAATNVGLFSTPATASMASSGSSSAPSTTAHASSTATTSSATTTGSTDWTSSSVSNALTVGTASGEEKKDNLSAHHHTSSQSRRSGNSKDAKIKEGSLKPSMSKKESSQSFRRSDHKKHDDAVKSRRVHEVKKDPPADKRTRTSSATQEDKDSKEKSVEKSSLKSASKRNELRKSGSYQESAKKETSQRGRSSRNVSPAPSTGSRRNASPANSKRNSSPSTGAKRTGSPATNTTKNTSTTPTMSAVSKSNHTRKRATRSETSSPANAKRARR